MAKPQTILTSQPYDIIKGLAHAKGGQIFTIGGNTSAIDIDTSNKIKEPEDAIDFDLTIESEDQAEFRKMNPNYFNSTPSANFPLSFGSAGPYVTEVQNYLLYIEPLCLPKGGADGKWGNETEQAIDALLEPRPLKPGSVKLQINSEYYGTYIKPTSPLILTRLLCDKCFEVLDSNDRFFLTPYDTNILCVCCRP